MAEEFGVEDRGHFYDPVGALRDVVVNHLLQLIAAVAQEPPAAADAATLKDAKYAVLRSTADADPKRYVRGQYAGYREIDGVAPRSTTETYAALRLEVDNWRWSGVPFFIRTGKRLPVTQTEVRLVFKHPPRLKFVAGGRRRPDPDQLVVRLDPTSGSSSCSTGCAPTREGPRRSSCSAERDEVGGSRRPPTRCCSHAALDRRRVALHAPGLASRRAGASSRRCSRRPGTVHRYAPGTWGPPQAQQLVHGLGRWFAPWVGT